MKSSLFRRILLPALLLLTISAVSVHATPRQLAAYIKVWGYLKYFSPDVTFGRVDWDSEFVALYPIARTDTGLHSAVDELIKAGGGGKTYGLNENHIDNIIQLARLDWLNDGTLITPNERDTLYAIYSEYVPRETRYVKPIRMTNNADFSDEDSTNTYPYPNEAQRALAIARHWNMVEYYYPDLDLIPFWADTLTAYIPRVVNARNATEYQLAMLQYCCSIQDGHSSTYSVGIGDALGHYYLPLPLTHIGRSIVFRKPHIKIDQPFHPGDILRSIGGDSVDELIRHYGPLVPHSNVAGMMRNICRSVTMRLTDDSVDVVYETADARTHTLRMKPVDPKEMSKFQTIDSGGTSWKTLDGGIGYIDMGKFTKEEVTPAMKVLSSKRAIIFDIRNYPKGTVWQLAWELHAEIPWAEFRMPYYAIPGAFQKNPVTPEFHDSTNGPDPHKVYTGKVIVLVNDETQSHAEYTAMMLRSIPGSVIIGSQTAGADGNVSFLHLPGGITTIFSGLGVYYPDGKPTQQIGIVPDIQIEPTIEGIRAGRDEVLEKAIEIAKQ